MEKRKKNLGTSFFILVVLLIFILLLSTKVEASSQLILNSMPYDVRIIQAQSDVSATSVDSRAQVSSFLIDSKSLGDKIEFLYKNDGNENTDVSFITIKNRDSKNTAISFDFVERTREGSGSEENKLDRELLNITFLESEGYLEEGKVPVIVSLNVIDETDGEEKGKGNVLETLGSAEEASKINEAGYRVKKLDKINRSEKETVRIGRIEGRAYSFESAKSEVLSFLEQEGEGNDGLEVQEEKNLLTRKSKLIEIGTQEKVIRKNIGKIKKDLRIVNALALDVNYEELKELEKLDSIARVELDRKVELFLQTSVPLINATQVWALNDSQGRNVTGSGVSMAIIDTGVDYTHPDLGGCFGSGCRVVGGYDFVNSDSNPMDDHGHGTHVAATATSNGTLQGVAPNATIYAYKVLNSGGSGYTSWVIAGVERATDPNNDGNYSDHVNILSMSLGGYGDENSSLSAAVDTAVSLGVVAVVAAGNSGTSSSAIGSPASSRNAITVGATDKSDNLAYFSSRGPSPQKNIKPDLTAPGVSICAAQWDSAWASSQCYDNKHVSISGTSMATPHVAGAAALILQQHPDWNPSMVKSALMLTTKDLGLKVWEQGTGRIDVYRAISAKLVTYPQTISFGQVTQGAISKVITIQNLNSSSISVVLNVSNITDGTKVYPQPSLNVSSLTIPQGQNASVNLSIDLSDMEGTLHTYLNITLGNDVYRIPFGFVRLTQLTVSVLDLNNGNTPRPYFILVHNENLSVTKYASAWDMSGNSYAFGLEKGNYTIHAIGDYRNSNLTYILTGNASVSLGVSTAVNLSLAEARIVNITPIGINNESIDLYKWQYLLEDVWGSQRFSTSVTYSGFGFQGNRTLYLSDTENLSGMNTSLSFSFIGYPHRANTLSQNYYSFVDEDIAASDKLYFAGWILDGVNSSTPTKLNLLASELAIYNYTYNFPSTNPYNDALSIENFDAIHFWISPKAWLDFSSWVKMSAPLKRTVYIKNGTDWGYWHYLHINYLRNSTLGGGSTGEWAASVGQEEEDIKWQGIWPYGVRASPGDTRTLTFGTSYFPSFFVNSGSTIQLANFMLRCYGNETYMYKDSSVSWWSSDGTSGTIYLPKPTILIYKNDALVSTTSPSLWKTFSYSASSGSYSVVLEIPLAYPSNNISVRANFTIPASDAVPPRLVFLNASQRFEINRTIDIGFNVTDNSALRNVSAYYNVNGSWQALSLTNQSDYYTAAFNITSQAEELYLKIFANDSSGNSVTYIFSPLSLLARNTSLNFVASNTTARLLDNITFNGTANDSSNNKMLGARIEYALDNLVYGFDRADFYDNSYYQLFKGGFGIKWQVPSDYGSGTASFVANFNGTGVYSAVSETTLIAVGLSTPQYSNVVRLPSSPTVNNNVTINSTWTSTGPAISKVLFSSNYNGSWVNYSTTNISNVYTYTILNGFVNASQNVSYRFYANNTQNTLAYTPLYSFIVQYISTNLTAGQTSQNINVGQNNTLWCEYIEIGAGDILNATVNAEIEGSNKTMIYNSTSGRYEYLHNSTTSGTKTWICSANKTNYQTLTTTSAFSVSGTAIPNYSNLVRTSYPIYNTMNVQINSTWSDDTGLSTVIFSSNYSRTWVNYSLATNINSTSYNATYTILSGNFSSGQNVSYRFFANDTSNNWNLLMPVQTFTIQNRAPNVTLTYDNNKGWGENWTIECNFSDSDNDTLQVALWVETPNGNLINKSLANYTGTTTSKNLTFITAFFNQSFIGSSTIICNATDSKGSVSNATYLVTVEKDDVSINITQGNNQIVQRYEKNNITINVSIYDADVGRYINTTAKIYSTKDGSQSYSVESSCTVTNGICSVEIDPDDTYSIGSQYFYGATLENDVNYKTANSSSGMFVVYGVLFTSVNSPLGSQRRNSTIYLNTTVTDDTTNSMSGAIVYLEYKKSEGTAEWSLCAPVNETREATYYCKLNNSLINLGWYDIRYSATKLNYTTLNTTILHQFNVIMYYISTQVVNFTTNITEIVNAPETNTTIEIKLGRSINNTNLSIVLNSTNPLPINLTTFNLGKYITINVSDELAGNLSYATIKVNYSDTEVNNSGINESSLRIWFYNTTLQNWIAYTGENGGVNTSENFVWANITHFSDFAVGGTKTNGASCTLDSECESGNCAEDYDGLGAWCATSGYCAHDYSITYSSGYSTCYGGYKETCNLGEWSEEFCSSGCSNGECITAPITSGGGGGGGGVSYSTYSLGAIDNKIEGVSRELEKSDRIKFNVSQSSHILLAKSVTKENATFELNSSSEIFTLAVNETRKFNFSSYFVYDLAVRLNNITNNKANVTIKAISDLIPLPIEIANATNVTETEKQAENITKQISKEREKLKTDYYAAILIVILMLIIYCSIYKILKIRKAIESVKKIKEKKW